MKQRLRTVGSALSILMLLSAGAHAKDRINVVYASISGLFLACWVARDAG
jgi:hypothetical protein